MPPAGESGAALRESGAASNYGFVQFRGVPNGAAVDLDRRAWVTSPGLENRHHEKNTEISTKHTNTLNHTQHAHYPQDIETQ